MIQGSGEEYNSHGEHVVEIPARNPRRMPPRRSFGTLGVALGLAVLGAGIAGVVAHEHSVNARNEAVQREQLKDGWSTLAALVSEDAQRMADQQQAPAPVANAAQPPPSTVVVVNVPVQGAAAPAGSVQAAPNGASNPTTGSPVPYAYQGAPYQGAAYQGAPYQSQSYQSGQSQGSPYQGSGFQGVPVPVSLQGAGNGTFSDYSYAQGVPNGTVPDAFNQGLVGSVPASNAVPNIPNGAVPGQPSPGSFAPGTNVNQSVSNGTIPGATTGSSATANGSAANGSAANGSAANGSAATANGSAAIANGSAATANGNAAPVR